MSKPPFKRMEINDLFSDRVIVFERPKEDSSIVVITWGGEIFHSSTPVLEMTAVLLAEPKPTVGGK